MRLFGGNKRPKLDGLTKEEEKRRDALNPEVLRRAGEKGVAGQMPAAAAILREKTDAEKGDFLWPLLLGWQMIAMRRFDHAIDAFTEAVGRDADEVRGYFGAGHAYFEAAEAKRIAQEAGAPETGTPEALTVDNLYHEALRNFRRAFDLTTEKDERDTLRNSVSVCEKALARKAGRM
jgi:tetratricopeptide (TPR) repeat protein